MMTLTPEFISERWPLNEVRLGPTLQQYPTRKTVALAARQGQFVAKIYQEQYALGLISPTADQIRNSLFVFDFLRNHGMRIAPELVRTRLGGAYVEQEGFCIYLMTYVDGRPPERSANTFQDLGRLAARLGMCWDFPYTYPVSTAAAIRELTTHADRYPFRNQFLEIVADLAPLEQQPVSLIHPEINPANALRMKNGAMLLLDWDTAGLGPTVLMAGYPMIVVFVSEKDCQFYAEWASAFYSAFTAGRGMTEEEKSMVFRAALLHALRSLGTRNAEQRWERVRYAIGHKAQMLSVIPSR